MAVIGLDWDLKIDAFYLLDHSQHKHHNNHQHFNYHDELIWTIVVGRIKKGKEYDYISIPMNNTSPTFSLLILKHRCLLEYQGQLQNPKTKVKHQQWAFLQWKMSSPALILFHMHVISSTLLESTISWQAEYY